SQLLIILNWLCGAPTSGAFCISRFAFRVSDGYDPGVQETPVTHSFRWFPTLAEPQRFTAAEMVLLVVLGGVSAVLFLVRFGPILRKIYEARSEPGNKLRPSVRGVREFFWEVLCQAKVIKERPLPGLAHAFVFWGFLAFALVSLNHFAIGLRIGFLEPEGGFGWFYFTFAALWAIAVAVSISGLFIRRFFVRPRWLGEKVSKESGVIAGLIVLLMVTYLAAFLVRDESGIKALWWIHTLTLL